MSSTSTATVSRNGDGMSSGMLYVSTESVPSRLATSRSSGSNTTPSGELTNDINNSDLRVNNTTERNVSSVLPSLLQTELMTNVLTSSATSNVTDQGRGVL